MLHSKPQMSGPEESIYLSPFESPSEMQSADVLRSFESAQDLQLVQHWHSAPDRDFQPGSVRAAWCPEKIHVFANLTDQDIVLAGGETHTSALAVSDVFQVFIDRPEHSDYLEIHVTPDNQARAIRWTPDLFAQFRNSEISIDEILLKDSSDLVSSTWIHHDDATWQVYLQIPLHYITSASPAQETDLTLRGTFCRFDASPDSLTPVLSSTSAFKDGPRFHETSGWHNFVLRA